MAVKQIVGYSAHSLIKLQTARWVVNIDFITKDLFQKYVDNGFKLKDWLERNKNSIFIEGNMLNALCKIYS